MAAEWSLNGAVAEMALPLSGSLGALEAEQEAAAPPPPPHQQLSWGPLGPQPAGEAASRLAGCLSGVSIVDLL